MQYSRCFVSFELNLSYIAYKQLFSKKGMTSNSQDASKKFKSNNSKLQIVLSTQSDEKNSLTINKEAEISLLRKDEKSNLKAANNLTVDEQSDVGNSSSFGKLKKHFAFIDPDNESDIRKTSSFFLKTEEKGMRITHQPMIRLSTQQAKTNLQNQGINSTLVQLVNDIREPTKSVANFPTETGSMFLPLNTTEFEDEVTRQARIDEESDKQKCEEFSARFFNENRNDDFRSLTKSEPSELNCNPIQIKTKEYLESILFPKSQDEVNQDQIYTIMTKILPNQVEVIEEYMFLIVLSYLYSELHNGLLELSENFLEERRKYLSKNFDTYITIVNFYLKSKEDFFLGVLSQIMSKLTISQVVLDNSFNYYMNEADDSDCVIQIKAAYDKVYKAGEKYSIAPKIITKSTLKKILEFELRAYEEYHENHQELSAEVLEIVVIDKLNEEFGFDKEAIRAAIVKHQVIDDNSFEVLITQLQDYKGSSFLNI